MFDCTKDLGGGFEDRLVVAKNHTFPGAEHLNETLVLIRQESVFGGEVEFCWMQAGAAIRDERAEIATFESTDAANRALGQLVERWGPAAITGDSESVVEIRVKAVRFTPVAREFEVDEQAAFDTIHDFTN